MRTRLLALGLGAEPEHRQLVLGGERQVLLERVGVQRYAGRLRHGLGVERHLDTMPAVVHGILLGDSSGVPSSTRPDWLPGFVLGCYLPRNALISALGTRYSTT